MTPQRPKSMSIGEKILSGLSVFALRTPPTPPPSPLKSNPGSRYQGYGQNDAAANLLDVVADALTSSMTRVAPPPSADGSSPPPRPISFSPSEIYLRALEFLPPTVRTFVEAYDPRLVVSIFVLLLGLLMATIMNPLMIALRFFVFLYVSYASFYVLAASSFGQDERLRPVGLIAYGLLIVYLIKFLL